MSSDGATARAPKLSIDTILESWCNMKAYDAHREKAATGERKSSQFGHSPRSVFSKNVARIGVARTTESAGGVRFSPLVTVRVSG